MCVDILKWNYEINFFRWREHVILNHRQPSSVKHFTTFIIIKLFYIFKIICIAFLKSIRPFFACFCHSLIGSCIRLSSCFSLQPICFSSISKLPFSRGSKFCLCLMYQVPSKYIAYLLFLWCLRTFLIVFYSQFS